MNSSKVALATLFLAPCMVWSVDEKKEAAAFQPAPPALQQFNREAQATIEQQRAEYERQEQERQAQEDVADAQHGQFIDALDREAEACGKVAEANGKVAEANGRLADADERLANAHARVAELDDVLMKSSERQIAIYEQLIQTNQEYREGLEQGIQVLEGCIHNTQRFAEKQLQECTQWQTRTEQGTDPYEQGLARRAVLSAKKHVTALQIIEFERLKELQDIRKRMPCSYKGKEPESSNQSALSSDELHKLMHDLEKQSEEMVHEMQEQRQRWEQERAAQAQQFATDTAQSEAQQKAFDVENAQIQAKMTELNTRMEESQRAWQEQKPILDQACQQAAQERDQVLLQIRQRTPYLIAGVGLCIVGFAIAAAKLMHKGHP